MMLLMLTSSLLAASAGPQTLGDAASAATREQRDRSSVVALTDEDLADSRPWEITPQGYQIYASIHRDLRTLFTQRPALRLELSDASRGVTSLLEMTPVLKNEPRVSAVLDAHHVTPREFLRMDQAVLTATYWMRRDTPARLRRQLVLMANIRFMREHDRLVREAGARSSFGSLWFDELRFITQP